MRGRRYDLIWTGTGRVDLGLLIGFVRMESCDLRRNALFLHGLSLYGYQIDLVLIMFMVIMFVLGADAVFRRLVEEIRSLV